MIDSQSQSGHIAILGARPGGSVAAVRAAPLGTRVTVVVRQALPGVCLNWGCIPDRAAIHQARKRAGL